MLASLCKLKGVDFTSLADPESQMYKNCDAASELDPFGLASPSWITTPEDMIRDEPKVPVLLITGGKRDRLIRPQQIERYLDAQEAGREVTVVNLECPHVEGFHRHNDAYTKAVNEHLIRWGITPKEDDETDFLGLDDDPNIF